MKKSLPVTTGQDHFLLPEDGPNFLASYSEGWLFLRLCHARCQTQILHELIQHTALQFTFRISHLILWHKGNRNDINADTENIKTAITVRFLLRNPICHLKETPCYVFTAFVNRAKSDRPKHHWHESHEDNKIPFSQNSNVAVSNEVSS